MRSVGLLIECDQGRAVEGASGEPGEQASGGVGVAGFRVGDLVRITRQTGHVASGTSGEILGLDRAEMALVQWTDGSLGGIIRVPLAALEQEHATGRGGVSRRRAFRR